MPYLASRSEQYKPRTLRDHHTLGEVAEHVGRDRTRIKQLEREGRLPAPVRVQVGKLSVRLYSTAERDAIKSHFDKARPERKRRKRR